MGLLTFTQLEEEIRSNLGGRDNLPTARIATILNLAQTRIARFHQWEELKVTYTTSMSVTSDLYFDRSIVLPNDLRDILSVRVYDDSRTQKLTRIETRRLDQEHPAEEFSSRKLPTEYARWGPLIETNYAPDKEYFIRFRSTSWPAVFQGETNLGQTSDLEQKDDMMIILAVNWLYQAFGNYERAGRFWVVFQDMLRSSIAEYADKPDLEIAPNRQGQTVTGEYWRSPWDQANP